MIINITIDAKDLEEIVIDHVEKNYKLQNLSNYDVNIYVDMNATNAMASERRWKLVEFKVDINNMAKELLK